MRCCTAIQFSIAKNLNRSALAVLKHSCCRGLIAITLVPWLMSVGNEPRALSQEAASLTRTNHPAEVELQTSQVYIFVEKTGLGNWAGRCYRHEPASGG
jgi:hypothetical protein